MLLEEIKVVVIKQGVIVKGQRANLVLGLKPTCESVKQDSFQPIRALLE